MPAVDSRFLVTRQKIGSGGYVVHWHATDPDTVVHLVGEAGAHGPFLITHVIVIAT